MRSGKVSGAVCSSDICNCPPPWKAALHYNRKYPYRPPEFMYSNVSKKPAFAAEPIIYTKPAGYTGLKNLNFNKASSRYELKP
jgi:hypothetical protein